jgi:hypothetical protein
MDKLSLEYKTFVSILGIIIITFFVYFLFKEKPIREGIPPFTIPPDVILPNMLTNTIQDVKRNISFLQANITARVNAIKSQITATKNATRAQATAMKNATSAKLLANKNAASQKLLATKNAMKSEATARKNAMKSEATARKNAMKAEATARKNTATLESKAEMRHKKSGKSAFNIITRIFGIFQKVFMVFSFFGSVFIWCFANITCGLEMFMNFRQCFFWYLLEIIGQTLYLPIRFLVWILGIQKWEKYTWDKIQAMDCAFYDLTGVHIIHYSDDILKRCYKCNPGPFPKWNIDLKVDLNPFSFLKGLF